MHLSLANPSFNRAARTLGLAGLFCSFFLAAGLLAAQTPNPQSHKTSTKPAAAHTRHSAQTKAHHEKAPPEKLAEAAPPAPPMPPKPNWPVDQPPVPATVTWDSHGLQIKASNSSLDQILSEISTDTGTKVEGLSHDVRIFGEYGPASARDVLNQLLHGTGYNILMIGDQGEGTPRQVILSAETKAGPQPPNQAAQQGQENDDQDIIGEEPQPGPVINQPPLSFPGNQPQFLTPQQRWQEIQQQRQRQIEQQQQGPPQQ